jgi:hypothetical protein
MDGNERAAGDRGQRTAGPRSCLFTVRLWRYQTVGGPEYRGSVREVISGANHTFRRWSDLTSFMIAQMEEDESTPAM